MYLSSWKAARMFACHDEASIAAISSIASAGGQAYSSVQAGTRDKQLYNEQQDVYKKAQAASDPKTVMAGIMALKQPLSDELRQQIIQGVTESMSSRGLGNAPGLVQEAIARALAQAELPLFQAAQQAYFQAQGIPLASLPRGTGATPPTGNPFQALQDYYKSQTQKSQFQQELDYLKGQQPPPPLAAIPTTGDTFAGVSSGMNAIPDPGFGG
jgi:hypothetical protein